MCSIKLRHYEDALKAFNKQQADCLSVCLFVRLSVCVPVSLSVCLGVCNKKLRRYEDALEAFNKLHNILRNSAQVMYQLADLYPFYQADRQIGTPSHGHRQMDVWIDG